MLAVRNLLKIYNLWKILKDSKIKVKYRNSISPNTNNSMQICIKSRTNPLIPTLQFKNHNNIPVVKVFV